MPSLDAEPIVFHSRMSLELQQRPSFEKQKPVESKTSSSSHEKIPGKEELPAGKSPI